MLSFKYLFAPLLFLLMILSACNTQELESQIGQLRAEKDSLLVEAQTLRRDNGRLIEAVGEPLQYGFEVQIGAFEYFDLEAYDEELVRLKVVQEEGLKKYVLGRFRKFKDAEKFLQDIRAMGVEDAFIAGVVDGKRSTVADATRATKAYYGF